MDNQQMFPIILALLPLFAGMFWRFTQIPFSSMKAGSLVIVAVSGSLMPFAVEMDSSTRLLACALLVSGYCSTLCQEDSDQTPHVFSSILVILGLTLGALLTKGLGGRLFLCGLLGFAAFSLAREKQLSFRTALIIFHFILAIILSLSSSFGGETLRLYSGLFLALTFLPLVPFHLPFVGTIERAKGTLSSFWIVVWLTLGLAELNVILSQLTVDLLSGLGFLALVSAFYASLATLGQRQINLYIASATVAHVSLLWGLLNVFPGFSKWGNGFGIAVGFVLGGICLAFSLIRQRYGWQRIGKLPGLATPMPRWGTAMFCLVSFALFLPMVPTFYGLTVLPTTQTVGMELFIIFLIYLAVWLGGGWYFVYMLHQTAFGNARTDVPYSDLRMTECVAVTVLILGAGYSGFLY